MGKENSFLPAQSINSFSNALEHDQTQWYAYNGIAHGEQFATDRAGRRMTVADGGQDGGGIIESTRKLPLLAGFMRLRLQNNGFHHFKILQRDIVFSYNHVFNRCK